MAKRERPRVGALSAYRQVRLTYTEEVGGRISYSVYVKPLGASWTEQHCVVRDVVRAQEPCTSLEDVFARLEIIIKEQRLPGID